MFILSPSARVVRSEGDPWLFQPRTREGVPLTPRLIELVTRSESVAPSKRQLAKLASRDEDVQALLDAGLLVEAPPHGAEGGVCLATTVREPDASFRTFVQYHLRIGFQHVFVFLDCPSAEDWRVTRGMANVTTLAGVSPTARVAESSDDLRAQVATEVMSRQIVNVDRALELAARRGLTWLVHIDADELFWCGGDVRPHFAAIPPNVGAVRYLNHEAGPTKLEADAPFREVSFFKLNPELTRARAVARWRSRVPRRWHFLAYRHGKGAVRVAEGARAAGVHGFVPSPRHPEILEPSVTPSILHYATCSLAQFVRKYELLGSFSDHYFGRAEEPRLSFHRAARDVVATGDLDAITRYYRTHVLFEDARERDWMRRAGLARMVRIASLVGEASNGDP